MTSSLVGSEMCIRDRYRPLWRTGGSQQRRDRLQRCVLGWMAKGPGVQAVSYTHLTLPTICSV
eukprot:3778934-Prorocentrum_lima.AAC.1